MSEERKTKTDAAAPASAALGRIDRKDAFLQALHTFLTAHQGTEWAVAAVDIQHFKLYNELYGTEKGDALLETVANCLLGYSRQTGYPVGYFGNDDFFPVPAGRKGRADRRACHAAGLHGCRKAGCHLLYGNGRVPCAGKPRCRCRHPCATTRRLPV